MTTWFLSSDCSNLGGPPAHQTSGLGDSWPAVSLRQVPKTLLFHPCLLSAPRDPDCPLLPQTPPASGAAHSLPSLPGMPFLSSGLTVRPPLSTVSPGLLCPVGQNRFKPIKWMVIYVRELDKVTGAGWGVGEEMGASQQRYSAVSTLEEGKP